MSNDEAAAAGIVALVFGILGIVLLISLAVMAVISWITSGCYKRIPTQFRKMQPGMVWLLMIPCFNLVWIWFVFPGLATSYKAYFDSVGDQSVGDCGKGMAFGYCGCCVASMIPYVGALAGLAGLVLLIIFLVKANELKNKIPLDAA